jgi:hypothetical protein
MGVKFRTSTQFREACTFLFCIHIIFLFLSESHSLLLLHDILIAADSSRFCACGMIVYFYRAALFPRLRHDSLISTEMPSFGASRYFCSTAMLFFCCAAIFCFHRAAYLLKQHDIFDFTAMPSFEASR